MPSAPTLDGQDKLCACGSCNGQLIKEFLIAVLDPSKEPFKSQDVERRPRTSHLFDQVLQLSSPWLKSDCCEVRSGMKSV